MTVTFQQPPKGKTIFQALREGNKCQRTGHLGCASIHWENPHFVVSRHPSGKVRHFDDYWLAINYFNRLVGKTRLQLRSRTRAQ